MSHDAVVIGAGSNGLTTAALLAKRGRKVLLLERRDLVGGLAAAEEFHPGYRSPGLLHDTSGVRPWVIDALGLERFGLRLRGRAPDLLSLAEDGSGLVLHGDPARAAEAIGERSSRDAERYAAYRGFIDGIRGVLSGFLDRPPLDLLEPESIGILELARRLFPLRRLGRKRMMELLRLPPMCVGDWLAEWFETGPLQAALAYPALAGGFAGPRSPGTNLNLLLREAAAGAGVEGGGPALVGALERAARDLGVELRTDAGVERILIDSGAACGVRLEHGEELRAPVVAASCDPKRALLGLLPAGALSRRVEQRMRQYRTRGTTAQMLLALDRPLELRGAAGGPVELALTAGSLLRLERAFDAVKYRRLPEEPILEIHAPTDPAGELAPAGHRVVSILAHFVPYDLEPGWDDEQRRRLGERITSQLERHAPGLSSSVVASELISPADLETRYGLTGGQIHHGEQALDQLLIRPTPDCAGYRTPVEGLFLCGGGSHPGGGLSCAPGALAAAAIDSA